MIIGICGLIGSGKGTVADILIEQHNFNKISFADALKDGASAMFGWPRHLLEGDSEESRAWREVPDQFWTSEVGKTITPRYVLQLLGTECMREGFFDNIWVSIVKKQLLANPTNNYVIPDVRFPNEKSMIKQLGGKLWHVRRGPNPEWFDMAHAANSDTFLHAPEAYNEMIKLNIHQSEWAWIGNDFDTTIDNDGSIDELKSYVFSLLYT